MTSGINSYLTFKIGEEVFGINVAKVLEIKEDQKAKKIPQALPFVTGVIDNNNEVIPLIDTGKKFDMEVVKIQENTCIIILQLSNSSVGRNYRVAILVDEVSDVFEYEQSEMKTISDDYRPDYIYATIIEDDKMIYILNADLIFNTKEIIAMLDAIKNIKKQNEPRNRKNK